LIVDVVDFEKGGGAFTSGGGEHGRVGERVALAVHEFARGADGFSANAENGGLAGRTNPEMALIEQEIDAMLFELDGEGRAFQNFLDDLDFGDADFVAAGGALFRADFAVTITLDSWVRPFSDSNASGFSLSAQTPWIMPVPSRKMGNSNLPDSRRL